MRLGDDGQLALDELIQQIGRDDGAVLDAVTRVSDPRFVVGGFEDGDGEDEGGAGHAVHGHRPSSGPRATYERNQFVELDRGTIVNHDLHWSQPETRVRWRRELGASGHGQPLREVTAGHGGGEQFDLGRSGAGGGIGHAGDAEPGQPSPDGCQIGCRRRRKALAQPAVEPEQPAVGTSIRAASCSGRCAGMIVEADRGDGR